jgi:protein TonB
MTERPVSLTASVALHGLLLLLLIFAWQPVIEEPLSEPVELVDLPWTAPGAGQSDRPAPGRPRPASQAAPRPEAPAPRQRIDAPKPAPVTQAPKPKTPVTEAIEAAPKPDLDALLQERLKDRQDREAKRLGELASSDLNSVAGTGRAPESGGPLQEGSVSSGAGMRGELGKRGILAKVDPVYPPFARRQGIEADVTLRVWVSPRGGVSRVEVVKLSGTPELDRRAIEALKQWKFAPLPDTIEPVTQWGEITLHYRLD